MVDNEIIIIGAFLGSGMIAYVIIPGFSSCGTGSSTTWSTPERRNRKSSRTAGEFNPLPTFISGRT